MSHLRIPGKHSGLWKEWRSIGRGKEERFFLEHNDAVLETLQGARKPEQVLLSRSLYATKPDYWEELASSPASDWYLLGDEELERLVSVASSGGLCAVFRPQDHKLRDLLKFPFILLAWEVQDPGNVGTLIRSCAGLAEGGLLLVGGCKPWSSKVARSSAGSLFRQAIARYSSDQGIEVLRELQEEGYTLYSSLPESGQNLADTVWAERVAVVLGNESHGVPPEVQRLTESLTIKMAGSIDSLNVAVAGSIICYEWSKSRSDSISRHG